MINGEITKYFVKMMRDDPEFFYMKVITKHFPIYEERIPKTNFALQNAFEYMRNRTSHLLYSPHLSLSFAYLSAIYLWITTFYPEIKVEFIEREGKDDYNDLIIRSSFYLENIDNIVKTAIRNSSNKKDKGILSGISKIYIVNELEYLRDDQIETILTKYAKDPKCLIIGQSTINDDISHKSMEIMDKVFRINNDPFTVYKKAEGIIEVIEYPVQFFKSLDEIEYLKSCLDNNEDDIRRLIYRQRKEV